MMDNPYFLGDDSLLHVPITKSSHITGEGRMKCRRSFWTNKAPDLKKRSRRKQSKKSRRINRR